MRVIGIDPGPTQSAWVTFDGEAIVAMTIDTNGRLLDRLWGETKYTDYCAIEMVACYGMPVGAEVFDTCVMIGRFVQAFGKPTNLITRLTVRHHLCHTAKAGDPNIRQALIDRFGGTRKLAIGTKRKPGPLHGVKLHLWAALAVAVTWWDTVRPLDDVDPVDAVGPRAEDDKQWHK